KRKEEDEEDEEEEEEEEEDEEGYRPEDEDESGGDPLSNLWADVQESMKNRLEEFIMGESRDVYTSAEREMGVDKVRTGLKRDLKKEMEDEDEDEDEDDEEDEEMGGKDAGDGDEDVVMLGAGGQPAGKQAPQVQQQQQQDQVPKVKGEQLLWFASRGDFAIPANIGAGAAREARLGRRGPGR
ncbi:hypothetical protein NKR19_g8142, partial [Coniochaeta hoffmannii]